jgi:hypothetical protein
MKDYTSTSAATSAAEEFAINCCFFDQSTGLGYFLPLSCAHVSICGRAARDLACDFCKQLVHDAQRCSNLTAVL